MQFRHLLTGFTMIPNGNTLHHLDKEFKKSLEEMLLPNVSNTLSKPTMWHL